MQITLKKYAWVINFVILAVIAVLAAVALNRVFAILVAPYTVPEVALETTDAKTTKRSPAKRNKSFSKPIVARCLFGCSEGGDSTDADALECPEGCPAGQICQAGVCVPEQVSGSLPILSDLGVKLMGVMVAKNEKYSMAVLKEGETTYIVGIGETILDAELMEIYRDRIIVKRNGRLEYIKLENTIMGNRVGTPGVVDLAPRPKVGTPPKDVNPTTSKKKSTSTSTTNDVKKLGKNKFELRKAALEEQLNDPKKLASQASVVPNYDKNGNSSGVKLVGVRSGSMYKMIGIENGDVVHKINGTKIKNQAHAFELLQSMRGASSATVELERKGKRETFSYQVK